ncbi:DUF86 domain-containing protein [Candidatus Amesbacteria bacterium]|nr:DUF86 domain-containing protein [Candidatus Amesbacteria bacterium]
MPINRNIIELKISKIREIIKRIRDLDFSDEQSYDETILQDALVFRLVQAVEAAIDIATHIISNLEITRPESYKDLFLSLNKQNILTQKTAHEMAQAAGFRNLAVHEYDEQKFDYDQVKRDYLSDVVTLNNFCAEIIEFLKKN